MISICLQILMKFTMKKSIKTHNKVITKKVKLIMSSKINMRIKIYNKKKNKKNKNKKN